MKKCLFLFIIPMIFLNCEKGNCKKVYYDKSRINEYKVIQDTCNTFGKYSLRQYFQNDTLKMEGYGQQDYKQGKWKYYNNNKIIAEGEYDYSTPKGIWNYNTFGNIDWEKIDNYEQEYKINLPKNYFFNAENSNSLVIANDTITEKIKLEIGVNVGTIENDFELWLNKAVSSLEDNKSIKKLNYKKINFIGIEDGYEFEYYITIDSIYLKANEIVIKRNKSLYVLHSYIRTDLDYSYEVLRLQMMSSFNFVEYTRD